MLNLFGQEHRLCDGLTRRDALKIGALGFGGLSLPQLLAAEEQAGIENMLEDLERYERDFGDGRSRIRDDGEGDRKLEAMANTPVQFHSLAEALIEQLALIRIIAADGRRHAAMQVVLEYDCVDLFDGALNSERLLADVDAVGLVGDHALDAAHMPFD